jgi:hypothetical protein
MSQATPRVSELVNLILAKYEAVDKFKAFVHGFYDKAECLKLLA